MKNMAGTKCHSMMMQANHIYYTRKTENPMNSKTNRDTWLIGKMATLDATNCRLDIIFNNIVYAQKPRIFNGN